VEITPKQVFDRAVDALLDLMKVHSITFCLGAIASMDISQRILLWTLHDYFRERKKDFHSLACGLAGLQPSDFWEICRQYADKRGNNTTGKFIQDTWLTLFVSLSENVP
jgi:hypothetical protein